MQLQGYDLVLQMTEDVIQPIIERSFILPGNEGNEPGQFPQEFSLGDLAYTDGAVDFHAIVTGISIQLLEGTEMAVTIPFERSQWTSPFGTANNLSGVLVLGLSYEMTETQTLIAGGVYRVARLQVPNQELSVNIVLDEDSLQSLLDEWGLLLLAWNNIRNGIQEEVGAAIAGRLLPILLNDFILKTSAGNGTLSPLRPLKLAAGNVFSASAQQYDLAVMGMFIDGKPEGQADGLVSAIFNRDQNVKLGLSKEAIDKLLLAGPLASALEVSVNSLPEEFGEAASVTVDNVQYIGAIRLEEVRSTLEPNTDSVRFDLRLMATPGNDLVESITADAYVRLRLFVEEGRLYTDFLDGRVDLDIDFGKWGELADWFSGGDIENAIEGFLNSMVDAQIQPALDGLAFDLPINLSSSGVDFLNIQLEHLDVCTTDAAALLGRVEVVSQVDPALPRINLSETLVEVQRTQIASETYEVPENGFCPFMREQDYVLTDFDVHQKSTILVEPVLLGKPVNYNWSIEGQSLSGTEGKVQFTTEVFAYNPSDPTGEEESVGFKEVEVSYRISENRLELFNRPEDASFRFPLVCAAQDLGGERAFGLVWIDFQGKQGTGYGDFRRDLTECRAGVMAEQTDPEEYESGGNFPPNFFILLPVFPLCDPLGDFGWIRLPENWQDLFGFFEGKEAAEMNGKLLSVPILDFNPHSPLRQQSMMSPAYVNNMVRAFKSLEARAAGFAFVPPRVESGTGGSHSGIGKTGW